MACSGYLHQRPKTVKNYRSNNNIDIVELLSQEEVKKERSEPQYMGGMVKGFRRGETTILWFGHVWSSSAMNILIIFLVIPPLRSLAIEHLYDML